MRAVIQRVRMASVTVEGEVSGEVGMGWLVLVGVAPDDGAAQVDWLAEKVANLRAFPDEAGKMNRSVLEVGERSWSSASSPSTRTVKKVDGPGSPAPRRRRSPNRCTTRSWSHYGRWAFPSPPAVSARTCKSNSSTMVR